MALGFVELLAEKQAMHQGHVLDRLGTRNFDQAANHFDPGSRRETFTVPQRFLPEVGKRVDPHREVQQVQPTEAPGLFAIGPSCSRQLSMEPQTLCHLPLQANVLALKSFTPDNPLERSGQARSQKGRLNQEPDNRPNHVAAVATGSLNRLALGVKIGRVV